MDDLIRRQDAIDAVRGRFSMPVDNLIVEVIGNLPSAQPTVNAVQVVRCKDCKWSERTDLFLLCVAWDEKAVDGDDFCSFAERRSEPEEGGTDDVPKTD